MKIILEDKLNNQKSTDLYKQLQTNLDFPIFNGKVFCNAEYEYHVFSRHDKNSYNAIQDHLNHNYIFLHWNSFLYYADNGYHYELISFFSISNKEMDKAIEFCEKLHESNCQSTSLLETEYEINRIIELSMKSNFRKGPSIIWDSELLGGREKFRQRQDLSVDSLIFNNPKIVDYFDAINFDNKGCWIVQYADGNAESMFRSFDMYWFYPQIIDYINHKKYDINYSNKIDGNDYEKLLDEEDFKNALIQMSNEIQNIRDRFDNLKLEILQQAERLYYMYSKERIELIVDFD